VAQILCMVLLILPCRTKSGRPLITREILLAIALLLIEREKDQGQCAHWTPSPLALSFAVADWMQGRSETGSPPRTRLRLLGRRLALALAASRGRGGGTVGCEMGWVRRTLQRMCQDHLTPGLSIPIVF